LRKIYKLAQNVKAKFELAIARREELTQEEKML